MTSSEENSLTRRATAKRPEGYGREKEKYRKEDKNRKDKKPDNCGRRKESNSVKKGQEGRQIGIAITPL